MLGLWQATIIFDANVNTNPSPLARRRYQSIQVMLDISGIDGSAQAEWSTFIEFAARTLGVEVSVGSFAGMPPEDRSDFVYIVDSGALSRKLLLNGSIIYIQPRSAPTKVDAYFYWKSLKQGHQTNNWQPVTHLVTLISSVFQGDDFLAGFLDNCVALHGYEDCEHLLIRPGSPGNEHEVLVEHVRQRPSAVYLNLAEDPRLYEVWNLGSRLATSRYISNANIDDRRAPEHVTHLTNILDANSAVTAASTALRISEERNLKWKDSGTCEVWFGDVGDLRVGTEGLFEERAGGLVSRNILHCMPLWRRNIHARTGGFDENKYGPSADWAFWVHAGMQGALFHLSAQPFGLYLRDEESYWRRALTNRQNDQRIVEEFTAWAGMGKEPARRHRSISREISDGIELLSAGVVYEGLGKLLYVAQQNDRLGETELILLNRTAEQFLGCKDFSKLSLCFRNALEAGQLFDSALANVWIDLVNSFDSKSARVQRTLDLACIDLNECEGDFRGLLLQALLAHKQRDLAYEQLLRKYFLDTDRGIFYETLLGFKWNLSCRS